MPDRKIVLTLPTPARILLVVLEVLLTLSLRVRGGDEVRERARGVIRVPRAGQLDARPATQDFARLADRYTMVHDEEVAGHPVPLRGRGDGVAGEEEKDERTQVAEGVRERSLHDSICALARILGSQGVLRIDRSIQCIGRWRS